LQKSFRFATLRKVVYRPPSFVVLRVSGKHHLIDFKIILGVLLAALVQGTQIQVQVISAFARSPSTARARLRPSLVRKPSSGSRHRGLIDVHSRECFHSPESNESNDTNDNSSPCSPAWELKDITPRFEPIKVEVKVTEGQCQSIEKRLETILSRLQVFQFSHPKNLSIAA
jgi:hypothetical protein